MSARATIIAMLRTAATAKTPVPIATANLIFSEHGAPNALEVGFARFTHGKQSGRYYFFLDPSQRPDGAWPSFETPAEAVDALEAHWNSKPNKTPSGGTE